MKKSHKKIISFILALTILLFPSSMMIQAFAQDVTDVENIFDGKMSSTNHEIINIQCNDEKTHALSLYLIDEDNSGRWTIVDIIDPLNQKILDSQNVYDFSKGVYLNYHIKGNVQVRLTNVWTYRYQQSPDTSISGIFFDGVNSSELDNIKLTKTEVTAKASNVSEINILGKITTPDREYLKPLDKEIPSIEIRFDGSIDPSNENLDKIKVVDSSNAEVSGTVRSSFNSAIFVPNTYLNKGNYTLIVPTDVKNIEGKKMSKDVRFKFSVEPTCRVINFNNGLGYDTPRVDLAFNDRLTSHALGSTLIYKVDEETNRNIEIDKKGYNGGLLFEIKNSKFIPNGTYTFTLPAGCKTISGAIMSEPFSRSFSFDSDKLIASFEMPYLISKGDTGVASIKECIGYDEVRYAFNESDLKNAQYKPVSENITFSTDNMELGEYTLYMQFKVNSGKYVGTDNEESEILHKKFSVGVVKQTKVVEFDMSSVYDKDGWASSSNHDDGVFDMATSIPGDQTGVYLADGFKSRYDQDEDANVIYNGVTFKMSPNMYVDGKANIATNNGKTFEIENGVYTKLYILAAGKSDDNRGTYTVNYSDGSKSTHEINAPYWLRYDRETEYDAFTSIKVYTGWWKASYDIGKIFCFEVTPDSSKTAISITLPSETSQLLRTFAMSGKKVVEDSKKVSTEVNTHKQQEVTYNQFVKVYGNDPILKNVADYSDITEITNIEPVAPGKPMLDNELVNEAKSHTTGAYGDSLYPYARQVEKIMSYKIRMQSYENYELDYEDVLEVIRRVDTLSRGLDKKVYLVGWQKNGHDTSFPDYSLFNERHKREEDKTSADTLKWLMKEAQKYNTAVVLHVNASDTYTDDNPLGRQMMEEQLLLRNADGTYMRGGVWSGHRAYYSSPWANWFSGNFSNNMIRPLLNALPELRGQSIHPDAWYTYADPYNEKTGLDTADAKRRMAEYMRKAYDMDLTTEFEGTFNPDTWESYHQDYVLYFPMIWQYGWSNEVFDPLRIPAYFQTGVNYTDYSGQRLNRNGKYFGEGTAVEPTLWKNMFAPITLPGLNGEFTYQEMTKQFTNTMLRSEITDDSNGGKATLITGNGQNVTSQWNGDSSKAQMKRTILIGEDVVVQEPGNTFMPMVWRSGLEIQAWSQNGFDNRKWKLPEEWKNVSEVDMYDLTVEGLRYYNKVKVVDRSISFSMGADQNLVIIPCGQNPNSTDGFTPKGAAKFISVDNTTQNKWGPYGKEGFEVFDSKSVDELGNNLPEYVKINYVNSSYTKAEKVVIPQVDKTLLKEVVNEADAKAEADYTPETWEPFKKSLDEAKKVFADEKATQEEVDNAKAALEEAMKTLVKQADKAALDKAIQEADAKDKVDYTPETWEPFKKALDEAKKVLADENATQEEVDDAEKQLKDAMAGLQKASQEGQIAPPEIIKGAEQVVKQGAPAEFTSNAEYDDFIKVTVDNRVVSPKSYTVKEGSTIVTLSGDFTKGLNLGKHSFAIESENGKAETTFTVVKDAAGASTDEEKPETGDNSNIALLLTIMMVCMGVVLAIVNGRKKANK